MKGVLVSLLLLAGCDRLFSLQNVATARDASSEDGAPELDGPLPDGDGAVDAMPDGAVDAMPDAMRIAGCPPGYTTFGGLLVKLVPVSADWPTAQAACIQDGAGYTSSTHLVVYTSDPQRGNVGALTMSAFWIGYTDRDVEGAFQWVTNEPNLYPGTGDMPWATGEPSSNGSSDDCTLQLGADDWDNTPCTDMHLYMCECDAFPADPTNY